MHTVAPLLYISTDTSDTLEQSTTSLSIWCVSVRHSEGIPLREQKLRPASLMLQLLNSVGLSYEDLTKRISDSQNHLMAFSSRKIDKNREPEKHLGDNEYALFKKSC